MEHYVSLVIAIVFGILILRVELSKMSTSSTTELDNNTGFVWHLNGSEINSAFSVVLTSPEECEEFQREIKMTLVNGAVSMTARRMNTTLHNRFCSWTVSAPVGKSIKMTFRRFVLGEGTSTRCAEGKLRANEGSGYSGPLLFDYCQWGLPPDVTSDQNEIQLQLSLFAGLAMLDFNFTFEIIPDHERPRLNVSYTSPFAGYVTSPGFDGYSHYPVHVLDNHTFYVPPDHTIMISFHQFDLHSRNNTVDCDSRYSDSVSLYKVTEDQQTLLWKKCGLQSIFPQVFDHNITLVFFSDRNWSRTGFRMTFTIHKRRFSPQQLNGKFDCSVPYYDDFQRHLYCNLFTECQKGEDEHLCPYNKGACNGSIAFEDKCYQYFDWSKAITWTDAFNECKKRDSELASLNTPREWNAIENALDYGHRASVVFIGLRTADPNLPVIYKKMWQWSDESLAYFVHLKGEHVFPSCAALPWGWDNYSITFPCDEATNADFICEYESNRSKKILNREIQFPVLSYSEKKYGFDNVTVVLCPEGHLTHDFLSCDPSTHCQKHQYVAWCHTTHGGSMPTFACENGIRTLPFTLVCDHRPDCLDNSDEEFCVHKQCADSTCKRSGECISFSHWCDGMQHCEDRLDEENCFLQPQATVSRLPPPAVISLDGHGNFSVKPLSRNEACPKTHFRCSGAFAYCLPVYLRCNGVYDCPDHEDEENCRQYLCPGFYRCRSSKVCVHPTHMCDGDYQCPQHDDELFCRLTCPQGCRCQGLAFVCSHPFSASQHPQLRYLDARNSAMKPTDLRDNIYLVQLNLAHCGIEELPEMVFHNLRRLDLSDNYITAINMKVFQNLKNLRHLILSNNKISVISCIACTSHHMFLQDVDLSKSQLHEFDTEAFTNFSSIRCLNLSSSPIHTIGLAGFSQTPHLEQLDMRNIPLAHFPKTMLKGLQGLRTVYAENYKLCCKATLPDYFDLNKCFAPTDDISSCEDLLRSNVYRFFLWIFASMSIVGNAGSFIYRLSGKEHVSKVGFDVLVTSLSVSDFLMGVYLVIIGAADRLYQGKYIWHDKSWKRNAFCQIAGCLSFLSSEVSAFIICLITLDRLLVFRYPFSAVRFRRRSAKIACAIAWAIGFALAAIPLLPMTSHWRFYGQTGICIPLPITRNIVNGRKYSFAIMSILNLFLFVLIALGQVFIFLSVRHNSIHKDPTRQSRDIAIARTLATIVLTDFLCWFPLGLLGLLALAGVPIPDEVNVGIAIFVLPLNSALNPFLYTFNTHMERRRRKTEHEMIRALEKRIMAELYADDGCSRGKCLLSQKEAMNRIKTLVKVRSSCSMTSMDTVSFMGRRQFRNRNSRNNFFEDSATTLNKQDAVALLQDMMERELITLDDISPLLRRKPLRQGSDNAFAALRNNQSASEEEDVFDNTHGISFA
ncbi:hypothetical protein ACOMHN_011327 [Nucella lapillus]